MAGRKMDWDEAEPGAGAGGGSASSQLVVVPLCLPLSGAVGAALPLSQRVKSCGNAFISNAVFISLQQPQQQQQQQRVALHLSRLAVALTKHFKSRDYLPHQANWAYA